MNDNQDAEGHTSGSRTPVYRDLQTPHNEASGVNAASTEVHTVRLPQAGDVYVPTNPTIADRRKGEVRLGTVLSNLPDNITAAELSQVFAATANALHVGAYPQSPAGPRLSTHDGHEEMAAHGHDAPSWSRTTSASVLLACTALYAAIAGSHLSCSMKTLLTFFS